MNFKSKRFIKFAKTMSDVNFIDYLKLFHYYQIWFDLLRTIQSRVKRINWLFFSLSRSLFSFKVVKTMNKVVNQTKQTYKKYIASVIYQIFHSFTLAVSFGQWFWLNLTCLSDYQSPRSLWNYAGIHMVFILLIGRDIQTGIKCIHATRRSHLYNPVRLYSKNKSMQKAF